MASPSPSLLTNASLLLSASIFQKAVVFVVNQAILTGCSPELVGKVSVQLELWLSMCLFLSRESIRMACLRFTVRDTSSWQAVINVSWLPSIGMVFVACGVFFGKRHLALSSDEDGALVLLYTLGALIECLGEPWSNVFQNSCLVRPRLVAESAALFAKSVSTFLMLKVLNVGVLSFGYAQVVFSVVLLWGLVRSSELSKVSPSLASVALIPRPLRIADKTGTRFLESELRTSVMALSGSLLVKQMLTEADKIALSAFASAGDQGVYALASNYGSLIARLVFLPLEDAGKLNFSRSVAALRERHRRGEDVREQVASLFDPLRLLLRVAGLLGSVMLLFGPFYLPPVLVCLLRDRWQPAVLHSVLAWYCIYLFALAVNGVSEGFVHSCAHTNSLQSLSRGLVSSSAVFAVSAALLRGHGGTGIVCSNILGMCVRVWFNMSVIEGWHRAPFALIDQSSAPPARKLRWVGGFCWSLLPDAKYFVLCLLCVTANVASAASVGGHAGIPLLRPLLWHVFRGTGIGVLYLWGCFCLLPAADRGVVVDSLSGLLQRAKRKAE